MSLTAYTAGDVLDKVASLMNDTAKTVYTYAAVMPYLDMALDELQEYFQLNNIPVTTKTSALIDIPVGAFEINPPPNAAPNYPIDLVEIQSLWDRPDGDTQNFQLVKRVEFLPQNQFGQDISSPLCWTWEDQKIKFFVMNSAREFKIDYIRTLFATPLIDQAQKIGIINAKPFLYYRTASLCALFIGENESRASELNGFAVTSLDRITGINVKGKQGIVARRKPFMSSYKSRGY